MLEEQLNAIINHPSVRPTAEQGTHRLDCGELLSRHGVLAFVERGKAILFELLHDPGIYRAHIFCVAGERGRDALRFAAHYLSRMFSDHGARAIEARPPRIFPHVSVFARMLGFKLVGETDEELIYRMEAA